MRSYFSSWCLYELQFIENPCMQSSLKVFLLIFFVLQVVIGQQFIVPSYSKVSLYQQPTVEDSDEELEYADNSSGTVDSCKLWCFTCYRLYF
jgi:hypothetical protein